MIEDGTKLRPVACRDSVQHTRYDGPRTRAIGRKMTVLCTLGILMQIGDTGGAYFTAAIAIHSFNTLVLRNKLAGWICLAVMIFGWLVAVLFGEL